MRSPTRAFASPMRTFLLAVVLLGCSSSPKSATPPVVDKPAASPVDRIVREELDAAVQRWKPTAAVAIVLAAKTGDVLAVHGRDGTRDDASIATSRTFVTGSTLKSIVLAAALEEKTIAPDAKVDCATRLYGTEELHDASPHGTLSLPEVLAVSSNVGTARVYDTLGLERLYVWLRRFHFDDAPSHLPVVSDPKGIQAAALAVGELAETTPMQMAAAYVALFNGGTYVRAGAPPQRVITEQTAATMVKMLEGVVTSDGGTGKLARIEGHRVAGKTGTGDHHGRYYGSFVGSVLDAKEPFVVLVGLELSQASGYTGASAAAPTFARIARRMVE